jgi:CubicO group peptidase (beta-lactamase class C family)
VALFVAAALGAVAARGADGAVSFDADAVAGRLHARLAAAAAEGVFSGEMLVARRGQVVSSHVYGGVAAGALFRIASVTKGFTAAATLVLVDSGKLTLQDPVARFFPELPPGQLRHEGVDVTVDQLLSHRTGLVLSIPDRKLADGEIVAALRNASFAAAPGARFAYSNEGYQVLGEIIRRVSGAPSYLAFLQQAVLTPLGLAETGIEPSAEQRARLAQPLLGTAFGLRPVRALFPEWDSNYTDWEGGADGALFSSVRDLTRWLDALGAGQLLSPEGHRRLFEPVLADYARGFAIETVAPGKRLVWHNGALPRDGWQSFIALLPEEGVTVVVLANVDMGALSLTPVASRAIRAQPAGGVPHEGGLRTLSTARVTRAGALVALAFAGLLLLPYARRLRPWPRQLALATAAFFGGGIALAFAPRTIHIAGLALLLGLGLWSVARFRSGQRWVRGEAAMSVVVAGLAGLIVAGVVAVRFVIGI